MTSTFSEPAVGREARHTRTEQRTRLSRTQIARQRAARRAGVHVPSVPLLHRRRLTDLIERAAARRVTVVCGPTGAGKTVACATWAAGDDSHTTKSIAWVSLDPGHRQPGQLWTAVRLALVSTSAAAKEAVGELSDPGDTTFPLRLATAPGLLRRPLTLVLADVQELAESEAIADLALLVRHGPPNLRLLLP